MKIEEIILTDQEAAKFLSLSASTLRKARIKVEGPPYIKMGRSVRYTMKDLEDWITKHRRHPGNSSSQKAIEEGSV